ncbi:MAG: hypothetical protein ACYDHY_06820 [Acidiferrobacterales bacterium]
MSKEEGRWRLSLTYAEEVLFLLEQELAKPARDWEEVDRLLGEIKTEVKTQLEHLRSKINENG